jgi:hypothetical protein
VIRGSQGMCKQFPGDPQIHLCNGKLEVYILNSKNNVLLIIIAELLSLAICYSILILIFYLIFHKYTVKTIRRIQNMSRVTHYVHMIIRISN